MTTISKPIMTIANRLQELTVSTASKKPRLLIRDKKEQTKLEEFIAKISLILHNLFTKGEFNIDLNDDNVNKAVLEIAVQCKKIIDECNNLEDIKSDSKLITVKDFPSIQIKFAIDDSTLNVTVIERNEYYYFPQEQLWFSIDLKDQQKKKHNLNAMYVVLSKIIEIPVNKLKCMDSILQYNGDFFEYLKEYFTTQKYLKQNIPKDFSESLENYIKPERTLSLTDWAKLLDRLFIWHDYKDNKPTVNLNSILTAAKNNDLPTENDVTVYFNLLKLTAEQKKLTAEQKKLTAFVKQMKDTLNVTTEQPDDNSSHDENKKAGGHTDDNNKDVLVETNEEIRSLPPSNKYAAGTNQENEATTSQEDEPQESSHNLDSANGNKIDAHLFSFVDAGYDSSGD